MRAKCRVREGCELIERLAGVEIVLEEEAPEAVVVESQPSVAALDEQSVVEERRDEDESILGLEQAYQHLGLVAADTGGPLEVGGEVFVRVDLAGAIREGLDGGGELLLCLLEALCCCGAALRG